MLRNPDGLGGRQAGTEQRRQRDTQRGSRPMPALTRSIAGATILTDPSGEEGTGSVTVGPLVLPAGPHMVGGLVRVFGGAGSQVRGYFIEAHEGGEFDMRPTDGVTVLHVPGLPLVGPATLPIIITCDDEDAALTAYVNVAAYRIGAF